MPLFLVHLHGPGVTRFAGNIPQCRIAQISLLQVRVSQTLHPNGIPRWFVDLTRTVCMSHSPKFELRWQSRQSRQSRQLMPRRSKNDKFWTSPTKLFLAANIRSFFDRWYSPAALAESVYCEWALQSWHYPPSQADALDWETALKTMSQLVINGQIKSGSPFWLAKRTNLKMKHLIQRTRQSFYQIKKKVFDAKLKKKFEF